MKNLSDKEFVKAYNGLGKSGSLLIASAAIIMFSCCFFIIFLLVGEYKLACKFAALALFIIILMIRSATARKIRNEAELGMSEKEASRRYLSIIQNPIYGELYPIVQKMCRLNPDAQSSQEEQINGWFTSEGYDEHFGVMYDKKFDFNMTYRDADFDLAIQILNKEPMSYRQFFVEKLFKLAVVDDGIHNDEWNLLMDIMKQLKFNKNYVDFFLKRYGPLRTEFEDDESGENTSTKNIPVSQLKAYFAILGLEEGASDVEVKKAYHNLALQHHPDLPKNADRVEECETMMARINEAYEKIRN
ncbi:MAG: DnaJ domain-containing protein [Paludibacteraceae bacterium]|nr:DnaJ domain-containing protein [Paludibacteraceae bacterium]